MSSLNLLSHEKDLMERGPSTLPLLRVQKLQSRLLGTGLNPDFDINSILVKSNLAFHKKGDVSELKKHTLLRYSVNLPKWPENILYYRVSQRINTGPY